MPVAAIYEPRGRRSHFRPMLDIARITRMVAWKLVSRGLDLPGLLRSLRAPKGTETYSDFSAVTAAFVIHFLAPL